VHERELPVLQRGLLEPVLAVAVHDGLFQRQLLARLRSNGLVHPRVLERRLRRVLRGRPVQRRLRERRLQRVLPQRCELQRRLRERPLLDRVRRRLDVHGRVLEWVLHQRVRRRRDVYILGLFFGWLPLQRRWMPSLKKKASKKAPDDPALLFRAVKWTRLPGCAHTIAEACERFGITASAYRKARRALGHKTDVTSDDELILAGISNGGATIDGLISYYDWINHAVISPQEVQIILEGLIDRGLVRRTGESFELMVEWP
jgi:hypothetical protein